MLNLKNIANLNKKKHFDNYKRKRDKKDIAESKNFDNKMKISNFAAGKPGNIHTGYNLINKKL